MSEEEGKWTGFWGGGAGYSGDFHQIVRYSASGFLSR